MTRKQLKGVFAVSGTVVLAGAVGLVSRAGDLEPPGPPGPTMKTLDEVRPGRPILAADLPLTISTSGVYYLAENVDPAPGGIFVDASDVTIDLMGFSLSNGTGNGILFATGRQGLVVRNGTVSGWSSLGLLLNGSNTRVADMVILGNGGHGIQTTGNSLILDTMVVDNGSNGISTGGGAGVIIVDRAVAVGNRGDGIAVGDDDVVVRSSARGNTGAGIRAGAATTIKESRSIWNLQEGIVVGDSALVTNCVVLYNTNDGIRVGSLARVENNQARFNGWQAGDGAGIHVTGSYNRIDGNDAWFNDRGIDVDATVNVIVRNSARLNGVANYDIVAGNDVGPIGAAASSTSPWANIQ